MDKKPNHLQSVHVHKRADVFCNYFTFFPWNRKQSTKLKASKLGSRTQTVKQTPHPWNPAMKAQAERWALDPHWRTLSLVGQWVSWMSLLSVFYGVVSGTFIIAVILPASTRWAGLRSRLRVKKHTWGHLVQEWVTPAALTAHLITNIWCTKSKSALAH